MEVRWRNVWCRTRSLPLVREGQCTPPGFAWEYEVGASPHVVGHFYLGARGQLPDRPVARRRPDDTSPQG